MAREIIDSCPTSEATSWNRSINKRMGQSFTGDGRELTSVEFYLNTFDTSITGVIYAKLYAHDGTYGITGRATGSVLATSQLVDAGIIRSALKLVRFTFPEDERVTLVNGTNYVIVCEFPNYATGNRLFSNYTTADKHDGNGSYTDGDNWMINYPPGFDYIFYAYTGDAIPVDIARENKAFKIMFH